MSSGRITIGVDRVAVLLSINDEGWTMATSLDIETAEHVANVLAAAIASAKRNAAKVAS